MASRGDASGADREGEGGEESEGGEGARGEGRRACRRSSNSGVGMEGERAEGCVELDAEVGV